MHICTYHIVNTSISNAIKIVYLCANKVRVPGLIHTELTTSMNLGEPIFSFNRMRFRRLNMFAVWEDEKAIDNFFENIELGNIFVAGWHVRMNFLRRWGAIRELSYLFEDRPHENDPRSPVVAVTIARMRLSELKRFIRWGRPVEKFVRDHEGIVLANASIRFPRTVSTFSIWKSQKEMLAMAHGNMRVSAQPNRHAAAMKERERRDFHFEFTTLRFKPYAEYGYLDDKKNILSI